VNISQNCLIILNERCGGDNKIVTMSTTNSEAEKVGDMCCASCGIAEVDDIKLKTCTACKSVRYCSVKCQRDHRPEHKKACKKRAAEILTRFCSSNPKASTSGTARSAFYRYRLMQKNLL
jgi:hypothetical protein